MSKTGTSTAVSTCGGTYDNGSTYGPPCVCSSIGGCNGRIIDRGNGFLCERHDPKVNTYERNAVNEDGYDDYEVSEDYFSDCDGYNSDNDY